MQRITGGKFYDPPKHLQGLSVTKSAKAAYRRYTGDTAVSRQGRDSGLATTRRVRTQFPSVV